MRDVAQDLGDADLEPVLGLARALAHDEDAVVLLDHGRRRHPVQRLDLVAVTVGPDHDRAVGLEHQQAGRLGQVRARTT